MKKILFGLLLILSHPAIFSQTITPDITNTEFCPGTNYQFTVTITGLPQKLSGYVLTSTSLSGTLQPNYTAVSVTNSGSTSNYTATIVFNIAFIDATSPVQGFRLQYTEENTSGFFYTADYIAPKVKGTPGYVVSPNPSTINAALCNTSPIAITFAKLTYTSPAYGSNQQQSFGQIDNYQYSVPNGWSVNGGTPSTDPNNWITGTNTATITPDGLNGNGGAVKIRVLNCNGSPSINSRSVPVTRPALSISGVASFCSTSTPYTIPNLPSGATVQWSASPSGVVAVNTPTAAQTTLTRSASGTVTLTAVITACGSTATVSKPNITVLPDYPDMNGFKVVKNGPCPANGSSVSVGLVYNNNYICNTNITAVDWQVIPGGSTPYTITYNQGIYSCSSIDKAGFTLVYNTPASDASPITFRFRLKNACGTWSQFSPGYAIFTNRNCSTGRMATAFTVSPNPATSTVRISSDPQDHLKGADGQGITLIQVLDKVQQVRKELKYETPKSEVTINISDLPTDTYFIRIFNGSEWITKPLVIKGR